MKVLDREYLGMGAEVLLFEEKLTEFFGRPAVCVVNGTAALQLALQAIGVGEGDEVLVQSLTYVASFQAISATGATPVACDVDSETLCLDWKDAEKRITQYTKAVMPIHYSGGVGALDDIYAFAEKYDLRVVEDAAHAFGSTYQGEIIGGFGDIACFSFDGIKNITSGEGGCVVSSSEEVLEGVRNSRLLGVENDSNKRYAGNRSWSFDVAKQGWRYHMSNIMASIGRKQLDRFSEFADKRQYLAGLYDAELSREKNITVIKHDYTDVVPHIYVVLLSAGLDRDEVRSYLYNNGIETGVHYLPNHWLTYYDNDGESVSNVETLYPKMLTLPLHPDLNKEDILCVCDTLKEIIG